MLRQPLKILATACTILALIFNVYIFTYPSLFPFQCSWRCKGSQVRADLQDFSLAEKTLYYAKQYGLDVLSQWKRQKGEEALDSRDIHMLALGDPQIKGNWQNTPLIKRLDTFGNDYYLGHIFSMMRTRLNPQFVAVMGDLFSSQWIGDSEFFNRTARLTSRVLKRNPAWLYDIRNGSKDMNGQYQVDWVSFADDLPEHMSKTPIDFQFGYENVYAWNPVEDDYLLINITGNHDVGYSGDATFQHMARFQELFGKDNYWIEYDADTEHAWRIVVLNSLLLEGPALQDEFLDITWEFLYQLFERRFNGSTVLLTHVPFYKEEGICVDGPYFSYYPEDYPREPYKANLLRSQNHLSQGVTKRVLNLIFDNEKPGVILTGHDHEGCETFYNKDPKTAEWFASKKPQLSNYYIKEITVKSMMGEFNGNAGLLTGHFNVLHKRWEWSFSLCPFSIQHIWWFTKVITILSGIFLSLLVVL
ncbi:LAMI_0G12574g1_1 [Lachancea mirantina]|uniref:LAMI_0G12574g1_1 n=1 Tax=Lachancea mirantina TaxID=1230905 RepID=A0A1G4KBF8_9SACH|nr:LAMI_0G12574g1_1 [Lachancea mirantina]